MNPLIAAAILALQAHFAASYIVPLASADIAKLPWFLAPLPWFWPWAATDTGLLGHTAPDMSIAGFFIAMTAAALSLMAAAAVVGWVVPHDWWKVLAVAGAVVSIVLMLGFFGPAKVIPIALSAGILYVIATDWPPVAALS